MKKMLAIMVTVALAFGAVACGQPAAEEPQPTAAEPGTEEPGTEDPAADLPGAGQRIGISMPTQSLQRWNQDGENMKRQFEEKGFVVDLQYANNEVNTQVSQIENMITQAADVLVIAAVDGSTLTDVLATAKEQGVSAIAYDRLIMNTDAIDYYATFDNFQVGVIQGKFIEEALHLESAIGPFNMEFFGGDPSDNNAPIFNAGAMSVLQPYIDSGKIQCPSGQIDFATIAIQRWDSASAQARMDNLLTAHYADGTRLDAVLSPNDSLAIGIVASLQASGYGDADKPYPVLTGQDCDKPNVTAMINGQQSMSVFKDTRTLAAQVTDMVSAMVSGARVPVNDTESYDNGVKIVPSFLCEPVFADANNYKELLIDSGYYTEDELK